MFSIYKKHEGKKKTHLWPKQRDSSFGPITESIGGCAGVAGGGRGGCGVDLRVFAVVLVDFVVAVVVGDVVLRMRWRSPAVTYV